MKNTYFEATRYCEFGLHLARINEYLLQLRVVARFLVISMHWNYIHEYILPCLVRWAVSDAMLPRQVGLLILAMS